MPFFHDLGGTPANEPCASLNHTPDFETVNRFEVAAYRVAIIARHGLPPAGCRLEPLLNRHEFGDYRTLALHVVDGADATALAYADLVEEGLGSWIEAGLAPPVHYDGSNATIPRSDISEIVIGALLTTRPSADGRFPVADFATLHANLSTAFPEQAATALGIIAQALPSEKPIADDKPAGPIRHAPLRF